MACFVRRVAKAWVPPIGITIRVRVLSFLIMSFVLARRMCSPCVGLHRLVVDVPCKWKCLRAFAVWASQEYMCGSLVKSLHPWGGQWAALLQPC